MGGNTDVETSARDSQVQSSRSPKDWKLSDLMQIIEWLVKLWPLVLVLGVVSLGAVKYFATSTALDKLTCESEKRDIEQRTRSGIVVLTSEKTSFVQQRTNLLKLQTLLLEIQAANKAAKLDLSALKQKMDKLVDEATAEEKEKIEAIKIASKDLESATQAVRDCEKGVK